MKEEEILRNKVRKCVVDYYNSTHGKKKPFVPGESYINYAGRVFDSDELTTLVDSALDFWLTSGRFASKFEKEFAEFLGVKYCSLTNSGSSANLLAMSALTSPLLNDKRLKHGDEVITVAAGFPTTVNPIVQNGLVPVFVDVELGTYNIKADEIENAISDKTKAIFIAHTLGNPFYLPAVVDIAERHGLWLLEDSCDALGSKYNNRFLGTFGHLATFSFFPAHALTMGEGGAVVTNDATLKRIVESFRDWGRDCYCSTGHDNSCGKRFQQQFGQLPLGYDHKYVYSHIGYNLKLTDMQAAVGVAQLKKLPSFIEARKKNFEFLCRALDKYEDYFILPSSFEGSEPCWFGFPLTVRRSAPFSRNDIVQYLEKNKIATRMLFAGNITRQPCFEEVKYRVHGILENTDYIMKNTFWVGVYSVLTDEMLSYIVVAFDDFLEVHGKSGD